MRIWYDPDWCLQFLVHNVTISYRMKEFIVWKFELLGCGNRKRGGERWKFKNWRGNVSFVEWPHLRTVIPYWLGWVNRPTQIAIVHQANGPYYHSLNFCVEYMGQAHSLDKLSSEWVIEWIVQNIYNTASPDRT